MLGGVRRGEDLKSISWDLFMNIKIIFDDRMINEMKRI
jgi:hypothetical protein